MFKLSDFFEQVVRDNQFIQTQFAGTNVPGSLCYAASVKFANQANNNPNISCLIVPEKLAKLVSHDKGLVIEEQAEQIFYKLHNDLYTTQGMTPTMPFGISDNVVIHPSAIVSDKTYIGDNVVIGPGVIIEDFSYIGDGVRLESGAIIGAAGHYYKSFDDTLFRVEHAGGVWLDEGVQVLAGAVISKSLHTDFTFVGQDTVVSVKAHIGHGCQIGKRCTLTGNVQVSGFTILGDDVWVGPSATIGNLLNIGKNSRIETGSVVIKDLKQGARMSGNFAIDHRKNIRNYTRAMNSK